MDKIFENMELKTVFINFTKPVKTNKFCQIQKK